MHADWKDGVLGMLHNLRSCSSLAFHECANATALHISMTSAMIESSHKLMLLIRLHVVACDSAVQAEYRVHSCCEPRLQCCYQCSLCDLVTFSLLKVHALFRVSVNKFDFMIKNLQQAARA